MLLRTSDVATALVRHEWPAQKRGEQPNEKAEHRLDEKVMGHEEQAAECGRQTCLR